MTWTTAAAFCSMSQRPSGMQVRGEEKKVSSQCSTLQPVALPGTLIDCYQVCQRAACPTAEFHFVNDVSKKKYRSFCGGGEPKLGGNGAARDGACSLCDSQPFLYSHIASARSLPQCLTQRPVPAAE